MELPETVIVVFLVVVILILIFSKITIGTTNDESTIIANELKRIEDRLTKGNTSAVSSKSSNTNTTPTPFNARGSDLVSPEFKKQLDEIQNRFYYDNCRYSRL